MIADRELVMRLTRRVPGKRRYHFHAPGLIYVGVTLFLAIGAINSQNNLLFAALGLAIGGLLVSGVLSGASLLGVRVERLPVVRASAGRPAALTYSVANDNRFAPAFGLNIVELPTPGGGLADWRGRFGAPRGFIAHIGAKQTVITEAVLIPRRRGVAELRQVRVWSTFPFGLARKSVTFEIPQPIVVQPMVLHLRPELIDRVATRSLVGVGSERMPGSGDDFFGLREYVPGDTPRRIAWRRTARTGDLVVRLHSAPSPVRVWVVLRLDGRAENGAPLRSGMAERAIAIAAAVARQAIAEGVAIGLAVSSPRIVVPPATGVRHLDRMLNELGMLDLADVARGASPQPLPAPIGRGSAVVVVHAGVLDRGGAPHSATHLLASDLDSYLRTGHDDPVELLALDSEITGAERRGVGSVRRAVDRAAGFVGFSQRSGA